MACKVFNTTFCWLAPCKLLFAVSLVFGIPTIKREKTSYLLNTLASLLDGMTQEDKDDSVIVIFVGEVNTFILFLSQPLSDKSMMCSQLNQISPWIPKGV